MLRAIEQDWKFRERGIYASARFSRPIEASLATSALRYFLKDVY